MIIIESVRVREMKYMQKNNRGFIATAVLYSLVILIVIILFLILKNLATTRKLQIDTSQDIKEKLIYYEVIFDGNGNTSGMMDKIRISSGKEEHLPKSTFEKIGYSFIGWALEPEGEKQYEDEAIVRNLTEAGKAITLYAKYNPNTYTITFNPNGGTVTTSTKSVIYGSTYGTLPIPTKPDYDFIGWFTEPNGGIQIQSDTSVEILEDQTLYAHWELSGHKVTYNYSYNGGTSSTAGTNIRIKEGESIPLTPTASKNGYKFLGWSTNANATSKLSSLKMGKNDVTLYAIYYKDLTITLNEYKGTSRVKRYLYPRMWNRSTVSTSVKLPEPQTATNSCGNFKPLGWTTSTSNTASTTYTMGRSYSFKENTTLYARYNQEIAFIAGTNGGSSACKNVTQIRQLNAAQTTPYNNGPYSYTFIDNARRSGMKFVGWGGEYWKGNTVKYSCLTMYEAFWVY